MANIKIDKIIDHLDSEIRRALEATLKEHFPNQDYNSRAVYKTFKTQIFKKCNSWENVPNKFIKSE